MYVSRKLVFYRIIHIYPRIFGADPDHSFPIDGDAFQQVAAKAVIAAAIALETGKLIFLAIVMIQTTAAGSNLDITFFIFLKIDDKITADAFRVGTVVFVGGEFVSIVPVQAVARADPHKSFTILQNGHHMVLRQSRIDIKVFKLQVLLLRKTGKYNNEQQEAA